MAFRILRGGVVECDTIHELRQLQDAKPRRQSSAGSYRSHKAAPEPELSDLARAFIVALLKAPSGLVTEKAAAELAIGPKSIPPQLRLLTKWSREKKVDLQGLLTQKVEYINRRPQTLYQLTEEGRKTFPRLLGLQSPNGSETSMNTG